MQLREWVAELNSATTERELVAVMGAFVRDARRRTRVPESCLPAEPASVAEIRKAASCLADLRIAPNADHGDRDAYQQLLVLFSLAADRIAMLETRGLLVALDPGPRGPKRREPSAADLTRS
jgi:hypothetical protein